MTALRFTTTLACLAAAVGPSVPARADDGDETLQLYLAKSDVVVLGEFMSEPEAFTREVGVVTYGVEFTIARLIKGDTPGDRRTGGTIRVNIVRFESVPEDRLPHLKKGGRAILFLKCNDRQPRPSYRTADVWFGVQPASPTMTRALARLAPPPGKKPAPGPERGPVPAQPREPFRDAGSILAVSREDPADALKTRMLLKEVSLADALLALTTYRVVTREQYLVYAHQPGARGSVTVRGGATYLWQLEPGYAGVVTDAGGRQVHLLHPDLKVRSADTAGRPPDGQPTRLKAEMTFEEIRTLWRGKSSLGQTCGEGVNRLTKETGGAYGVVYPCGRAGAGRAATLKVWYFRGKDRPYEIRGPGFHYFLMGGKYVAVEGPPGQ